MKLEIVLEGELLNCMRCGAHVHVHKVLLQDASPHTI
jgi:hypothetical protein